MQGKRQLQDLEKKYKKSKKERTTEKASETKKKLKEEVVPHKLKIR